MPGLLLSPRAAHKRFYAWGEEVNGYLFAKLHATRKREPLGSGLSKIDGPKSARQALRIKHAQSLVGMRDKLRAKEASIRGGGERAVGG